MRTKLIAKLVELAAPLLFVGLTLLGGALLAACDKPERAAVALLAGCVLLGVAIGNAMSGDVDGE